MSRKFIGFWFIFLPDIALLYAGLWLSIRIRYADGLAPEALVTHYQAFSVLFIFWLIVFFIHGLFEGGVFRRYTTLFFNLISAMVVNLLIAIIYFYVQTNVIITPRRFLLIDIAVTFVLVLAWHMVVKYFLKNRLIEGIYLFSFNNELAELEREIKNHSFMGFRVLGHLNAQTLEQGTLEKKATLILPDTLHANSSMSAELYKLRTLGVSFYNHKDFYELLLRRIYLFDLNELWFLENINYSEKRFYNLFKRLVDIVCGVIGFAVFLVSYPFVALAMKLDSSGPILFKQKRVGKNGEVFEIYKYRSMTTVTDTTWTKVNDSRITRMGNVLRKSRIDELPQSINLLKGNISLVGPRPEQVGIVETLRKEIPFYDERHLVKPGITGWAQMNIYAGSLEETKLKLQYDLYYIKHRSLLFDLEIILKTIYYIFTWQGR